MPTERHGNPLRAFKLSLHTPIIADRRRDEAEPTALRHAHTYDHHKTFSFLVMILYDNIAKLPKFSYIIKFRVLSVARSQVR